MFGREMKHDRTVFPERTRGKPTQSQSTLPATGSGRSRARKVCERVAPRHRRSFLEHSGIDSLPGTGCTVAHHERKMPMKVSAERDSERA